MAVFLATCFIIGPEQVHALHVEALSAHLAAGSAIGLTENVTVDYTYDDNGNMIQRVSSVAGTTNYTYDSENRLIKVVDPNGSLASIITYAYDTDGIRTAKITGAGATTYLTDKNRDYAQVLEERNGDTRRLDVRYTYGHDLISQHRPDGAGGFDTHYYHYDGQLSTRQLSDDQGDPTDSYTYDAFGEMLGSTGSTINNFLYTGEQFDANAGFYYLRARYQDPALGRFLTQDSYEAVASEPVTIHRYLYVGAQPISRIDPSGNYYGAIGTVGLASSAYSSAHAQANNARAVAAAKLKAIDELGSILIWGAIILLFADALGIVGGSAAAATDLDRLKTLAKLLRITITDDPPPEEPGYTYFLHGTTMRSWANAGKVLYHLGEGDFGRGFYTFRMLDTGALFGAQFFARSRSKFTDDIDFVLVVRAKDSVLSRLSRKEFTPPWDEWRAVVPASWAGAEPLAGYDLAIGPTSNGSEPALTLPNQWVFKSATARLELVGIIPGLPKRGAY